MGSLQGQIRPASDKSLTHRAYMLAAIADGPSTVRKPLVSQDAENTLECLCALGMRADEVASDEVRITPAPIWHTPKEPLYCGNSGTTMRLMSGLVASRPITATFTGDESLSKRPMKRVADPLRLMGARVDGDTPPLIIYGSDRLSGIDYTTPVASAQIKSCILLAGLNAHGETTVREPSASRDHTERMLRAIGVNVERFNEDGFAVARLAGPARPKGFEFTVPADISSAAFFMVGACVVPAAWLQLFDVGINPTRTGILEVLKEAGVTVVLDNLREELNEPIANIEIRQPQLLQPFEVEGSLVPTLIDEIPILAVLATQCDGRSTFHDAHELRVKESDRIELIARNLRAMGANVETFEDGLAVSGPVELKGAEIETAGDHRIAMAFAIAGLIAEGRTIIKDAQNIATSYPDFEGHLWSVCVV